MRSMPAVTAAAIALLAASAATAQCVGDANGNGTVEVNEAVLVVNNLLNGCPGGALGCPYTFQDDVIGAPSLCAFKAPSPAAPVGWTICGRSSSATEARSS